MRTLTSSKEGSGGQLNKLCALAFPIEQRIRPIIDENEI
jgi:hypothetical protein